MAEMIVSAPLDTKLVDDYDFTFVGGIVMNLTLDPSQGDTISQSDSHVRIYIAPRPSLNDPKQILPEADTTLFKAHMIAVQHRQRAVTGLTPEEQAEWAKTFDSLS